MKCRISSNKNRFRGIWPLFANSVEIAVEPAIQERHTFVGTYSKFHGSNGSVTLIRLRLGDRLKHQLSLCNLSFKQIANLDT